MAKNLICWFKEDFLLLTASHNELKRIKQLTKCEGKAFNKRNMKKNCLQALNSLGHGNINNSSA